MDKRFLAIIGAIIVVFVGILAFQGSKSDNNGSSDSKTKPTNHVIGNLDSKVTLVEYGDYQCPACEGYFTTVQAVQQKYNDKIKFQFRNLPLTSIHPNALAGARAAEAADMQGKYWQMHDALYNSTNWNEWSTSNNPTPFFWTYAQGLGMDVPKFKKDFASSAANNRVQADVAAFKKTGEPMSTPTFFINGKVIDNPAKTLTVNGAPSVDAFSKVIDKALKDAGQQ